MTLNVNSLIRQCCACCDRVVEAKITWWAWHWVSEAPIYLAFPLNIPKRPRCPLSVSRASCICSFDHCNRTSICSMGFPRPKTSKSKIFGEAMAPLPLIKSAYAFMMFCYKKLLLTNNGNTLFQCVNIHPRQLSLTIPGVSIGDIVPTRTKWVFSQTCIFIFVGIHKSKVRNLESAENYSRKTQGSRSPLRQQRCWQFKILPTHSQVRMAPDGVRFSG